MLAFKWHTGKPGAKGRVENPERDQIRRAAYLTFYVALGEPSPSSMRLAGLRWKLVKATRRGQRGVLLYRRVGPKPKDCGGGG